MNLLVEWFGTTAHIRVDGDADGLRLPDRPGLRVVDDGEPDVRVRVAKHTASVDDTTVAEVGSVEDGWGWAWRHLELEVAARSVDPVFIHAGAVAIDGRGIVIPGRSRVGKTTLVLELVRAGATYFSDEYALISSDGILHPYPRDPHVRGDHVGRGSPVSIGTLTERVGRDSVSVAGVVMARFEDGAQWAPETRDARACVLALLDNAVGARTRTPAVMDAVAAVARSAWCVEGVRGDVAETSEWLVRHVTQE